MPDIIQLLPDAIANQIAAGEVVQRPASIVKELIENAIDAGAGQIKLLVGDSGKSLIQVIDNGSGMTASDARLSFERHATSKIRTSKDLFSIKSMGFRGEALASIAAIAQVELKTKNSQEELGTRILISASNVQKQEICVCPQGTNIAVKNIFFNVPARRKFLKSDTVEFKHILDEFSRLALSYPDIFFSLYHNDKEILHLPASNERQRLVSVLGKSYNEKLVPISESTEHIKIHGFIGKPEHAKRSRGEQYFFVNKRFIKSPYLNHAIKSSYEGLIGDDQNPLYAIYLEIDPARIDINVHPTKQEIKFQDERMLYNVIKVAAKHALGQYNITPTLDFEQDRHFSQLTPSSNFSSHAVKVNTFNPKEERSALDATNIANWESLYKGTPTLNEHKLPKPTQDLLGEQEEHKVRLFQVHRAYILMENQKGVFVIDQHLAHQRVLYETFLNGNTENTSIQKVLFPINIEFNATEALFLNNILETINELGFDLQNFGNNSFVLHGTPVILGEAANAESLIRQMLDDAMENRSNTGAQKLKESLAKSIAKKSALSRNKMLSQEEMESLVAQLFSCSMPDRSPFGHKSFIHYTIADWQKEFEKKG